MKSTVLTGRALVMDETFRIAMVGMGIPAALGLLGGIVSSRAGRIPSSGKQNARAAQAVGVSLGLVMIAGAVVLGFSGVHGSWRPGSTNMDARLQASGLFLVAISMIRPVLATLLGSARGPTVSGHREVLRDVVPYAAICVAIAVGSGLWSGTAGSLVNYAKVLGGSGILVAALTLLVAAVWAMGVAGPIARAHMQSRPIVGGVLMTGMALATGGALLGTGSVTLGQYGFVVAAIAGGTLVATLIFRGQSPAEQPVPIITAALCMLLACGVVFSETPLWVFGTLGVAPLLGMLAERLLARRARPIICSLVLVGVTAVVALIAVGPGILELVQFLAGTGGNDPYADYR